ncbi:MAG TPA: hydantoinase B/oxoprolinase family protein [Solirubrobacter sp.]|nr:hydantoinase B/oxoprolinase family protein [Solirubrobacter sp.]
MDPILVEVLGNRVISIVNEQQAALIRTAFSTVVRESEDLACGVFDSRGWMIAQSLTGTPGHINAMATGVRHFLTAFPPETLQPGDVLVTNDPWQTSGQINDFTVVTPVFHKSRAVAFFANTCHAPDVGGRILSAESSEVYEEGLRVPIMKLFDGGAVNRDLVAIVRANVRTPDETVGDLYAQAACNDVGARRLAALLTEFELDSVDALSDEIVRRSEQAMRAAIAALPDGTYEHESHSDGFDEPVRLNVAVTVAGDELTIDFAGSSPQSRYGINLVLNYTHAYASFAAKAALAPEVPHNEGSFRPVHVTAPEGSILNCLEPAPVGTRHLIGHLLPGVIFGALAPAIPNRLIATGADATWLTIWRGAERRGAPFSLTVFQSGGTGARAVKDGLSATGFPSGVAGVPAEVIETLTPLVQHQRALRADSGGAGRQRGGLGQDTEMSCRSGTPWSVSTLIDRLRFGAGGLEGGLDGAPGALALASGAPAQPKTVLQVAPDDRVRLALPGGGGYGDPRERDPEQVLADVVDGYVTLDAARELYGVAIRYVGDPARLVRTPDLYAIDAEETARLRAGAEVTTS